MHPRERPISSQPDLLRFQCSQTHAEWLSAKRAGNAALIEKALAERYEFQLRSSPMSYRPLVMVVASAPITAIVLGEVMMRNGFRAIWMTEALMAVRLFALVEVQLLIVDLDRSSADSAYLAEFCADNEPLCPTLLLSPPEKASEINRVTLFGHVATKPLTLRRIVARARELLAPRISSIMQ
jgi:hypothetical protein